MADHHPRRLHLSELPHRFATATGAAEARSALTLRAVLATFGLVLFIATAIVFAALGLPTWTVIAAAIGAAIAAIDLTVVIHHQTHP